MYLNEPGKENYQGIELKACMGLYLCFMSEI